MKTEMTDLTIEAIKASPPLAVMGATVFLGFTSQDWAYTMTAIWFGVQTAWFVGRKAWRWYYDKPMDTVRGE
jgi:hypothetical protein